MNAHKPHLRLELHLPHNISHHFRNFKSFPPAYHHRSSDLLGSTTPTAEAPAADLLHLFSHKIRVKLLPTPEYVGNLNIHLIKFMRLGQKVAERCTPVRCFGGTNTGCVCVLELSPALNCKCIPSNQTLELAVSFYGSSEEANFPKLKRAQAESFSAPYLVTTLPACRIPGRTKA